MSNFNPTEIQSNLSGVSYPATGTELADQAERNGANTSIVEQLRQLGDTSFDGPDDVMKSIGG